MAMTQTLEETAVAQPDLPSGVKVDRTAFIDLCAHLSSNTLPVTLNNLLVNLSGLNAGGDKRHDLNACIGHCRYFSARYDNKPDLTFGQLRQEQPDTHLLVVYAVYCAVHKLGVKV